MYITFNSHLSEMHANTRFALQVKTPSSLPTVRNKPDIVN